MLRALEITMNNELQERYVFWRMATQDLHECYDTLDLISKTEINKIKMSLFKSAVVAYCRPFSGNEAKFKKQKWKLDEALVDNLDLHNRLLELRSRLFAHSDVIFREPNLCYIGGAYGITMKGFHFKEAMGMVGEISILSKSIEKVLVKKIEEYERSHF